VTLVLDAEAEPLAASLQRLAATEILLREHPGECPVFADVVTPERVQLTIKFGENWRLNPCPASLDALRQLWGDRLRISSQSPALPAAGATYGHAG
jgi:hypothetical protein